MRLIRTVLFALLFSLIVGFVIGTVIRMRYEKPERYIGAVDTRALQLPLAPDPSDVLHSGALVLEPRQREEEVG